jgi:polysaccharide biosynthesis protein PslH
MRVLHLTPELPYWPGGTGGATRQFHLLRRLVELGHEVTVVAPIPAMEAGGATVLESAGIRLVGTRRPPSRVAEVVRAAGREPGLAARAASVPVLAWQVEVFWTALRPIARRVLEGWRPDVVTIEHDAAASWVADVPPEIPATLVLQNVGPHYYESRARAAGRLARLGFGLEASRFRNYHAGWLSRYRTLIAMSDRDAGHLRGVTDTPVAVVPNGVASDELTPAPPSEEPATLLFTGTLSHPPNSEGIRWFADAVWARIRAARPDARLLVVGRSPPRAVLELAKREGIEVVGPVGDMAPFFGRATAVVVPIRSGGGTRLKILEALACRRAVLSTGVGCEGLDLAEERELLVADDPSEFAASALRLLEDPVLRERLAAAGRETAERLYDWRVLGDRLAGVLAGMA